MAFEWQPGLNSAFGAALLAVMVFKEDSALSVAYPAIAKSRIGVFASATKVAIVANLDRFVRNRLRPSYRDLFIRWAKPFDVRRSEDLYSKNFPLILCVCSLLLINIAFILLLTWNVAHYLFFQLGFTSTFPIQIYGFGSILWYFVLFILGIILTELVKSDFMISKEKANSIEGKRVASFQGELPRFILEREKVMAPDIFFQLADNRPINLSSLKKVPDQVFPDKENNVLEKTVTDAKSARAYLIKHGFIDRDGNPTPEYSRK